VIIYFLIPFLPRLPFLPGHTIETNGVMGTVDAVSTFHTTIRKFDGTMAFLPNALVVATRILNYSDTPNRRIEMSVVITPDSDLDSLGARLVSLVAADERVLEDPVPSVFAMNADASGVQVTIFCWVKNDDFLGARSDLWLQLVKVCQEGGDMKLAPPKQEVLLKDSRS
jgi:small conductance mechanosensitive channel